ncbi:MAG: 5'-methylthioadenosine/adenosylhomocysteine nucleosidase, partial [Aquabacterium sp.]|nr:5'-methylthioadenosine/adenosylhomocysteine nucleosidase [Aquabacterium sp.]
AAATTATALIEHFGVARIVFTGVAGGVGDGVHRGDVVVAQDYVQHDMDASPLFPRWELPGYARTRLACDPVLTAMLLEAASLCVTSASSLWGLKNIHGGAHRAHHGLVASGDRFVSTAQESERLGSALRAAGHDVLAVEMEGAAVAQVCHDYGLPFAAVRTISDRADDAAHGDFAQFVQTVASRYAEHMVLSFLQKL